MLGETYQSEWDDVSITFVNGRKELKGKSIHDIYGRIFKYDYVAKMDESNPFYVDSMPSHPFPLCNKVIVIEITGSWFPQSPNKIKNI